jgi:hypothetical protein
MNMKQEDDVQRARTPFRVLAGFIALVSLYSGIAAVGSIQRGYLHGISTLLLAVLWVPEFVAIAIRGDGLWFFKSSRFKKRKVDDSTEP